MALLAALQGDGAARQSLESQLGKAVVHGDGPRHGANGRNEPQAEEEPSAVEEVPMYIFLDATAVRRMMHWDSLFTFKGLLNLCHQGHMKCTPPEGRSDLVPAEENERIIFLVTHMVLEELGEMGEANASDRENIEWLRNSPDSYLQKCLSWGVMEILETNLHTQLMRLTAKHEHRAQQMKLSHRAVKLVDFACLWESQIEAKGRVLFVTANESVQRFAIEAAEPDSNGRKVRVLRWDDLDRRFSADHTHGGARLTEMSIRTRNNRFCGYVLSAQLMTTVLDATETQNASSSRDKVPAAQNRLTDRASGRWAKNRNDTAETVSEVDALRQELREAMVIVASARQLLTAKGGGHKGWSRGQDFEASKCIGKMDAAQQRWQALLARDR